MSKTLKILGVHGLGDHRQAPWKQEWEAAVRRSFPTDGDLQLEFAWVTYDDIFADVDLSLWQTTAAVAKLVSSGVGELFEARKRGFFDNLKHDLRWYAGYVVAWVENEEFKRKSRQRVVSALKQHQPDVVLAHSLGSLVTYNAFSEPASTNDEVLAKVLQDLTYVTLGSQIGNPFVVRNLTPGRIAPLSVRQWVHLYNREDDVFTAPIRLPEATNFKQVETFFDVEGFADHSATAYLSHAATIDQVWQPLSRQTRGIATRSIQPRALPTRSIAPRRRALLIGINDYPDPAARLDGCVNDVFLMSSVLQESGFAPEQIRICLNDRATSTGIKERLEWLVNDARPGDNLVFYYSGHGAQLPTYGDGDTVDQMDETLVPFDFDWTPERCVTDDHIFQMYSQLPYATSLAMIFDCCHSGGIHRSGSRKARGLEPPDDIRHRAMRWNAELQMWETRELRPLNEEFTTDAKVMMQFAGAGGAVRRMGRAMSLRATTKAQYEAYKKAAGAKSSAPIGPYLPLILEACQEAELASEYRHGNESYGAFTFSLAKTLRLMPGISFEQLVKETDKRLKRLGFEQTPQILGPNKVMVAKVPWLGSSAGSAPKNKSSKKKATKKKSSKKKKTANKRAA